MSKSVVGFFDTYREAAGVVRDLEARGQQLPKKT